MLNSTLLKRCALNVALLVGLMPLLANANPTGASIVSGQVSIDTTTTPHKTTITNSPNAIINWQNFSIAQNETTQFVQQSSQSAVLNRVVGQNPSQILGQLYSNGKVFLINPNGIVFGQGATVDVQGLIASSLNLSDQDFLNGNNYHFIAGSNTGSIVNEGIIRAGTDGNILLIAPQIQNSGIIQSNGGNITLAAGQEMTLTSLVNPYIRFQIQAPANSVLNLGQLLSEGGEINVFASTITHSGAINADSVQKDKQGNIQLIAQQAVTLTTGSIISANNSQGNAGTIVINSKTDTTLVQGDIQAQATGQTGQGGSIQVLGQQLVLNNATINASGQNGGGQILVGGDQHGANASVQNAQTTVVDQFSNIKADAISKGNGGKVIVWSDNNTHVGGTLSAQGGSSSGNGGFIETSGAMLNITSTANISTSAPKGTTGTWLLDPTDFNIALNNGNITGDYLGTMLDRNNVVITTNNGEGRDTGNIYVNDAVTWSGHTLTLNAANDISINAAMKGYSQSGVNAGLTLNAGANGNISISSDINLHLGTLALNGATTLSSTGIIQNATLKTPNGSVLNSYYGTLDGVTIGSNLTETGTFNINNNLTLANGVTVNMGSSIWNFNSNANNINSSGTSTINIAGGVFDARGNLNINLGTTLQGYGIIIESGASTTVDNYGQINVNGSDSLTIANTKFNNHGILNIASGASLAANNFTNAASGTTVVGIRSNLTLSGESSSDNGVFNNLGTVNIESGSLSLIGGNTAAGTFNVSSGATLAFSGLAPTFTSSSGITGAGAINFNVNGDLALPSISAGSLLVISSGNIIQNGAFTLGAGGNVVLSTGGNYLNNTGVGAGAFDVSGGGTFLVYAANPASVTKNGITSDFRQYKTLYGSTINSTGNGIIYASAPGTLDINTTLLSGTASNTYGATPTAAFGYTINPSGYDSEDLAAIAGSAQFTPTITSATSVGSYSVGYLNGLTSAAGYHFKNGTSLAYVVNPAMLSIITAALTGTVSKTYDGGNTATLSTGNFSLGGFANNDSAAVTQTTGIYASKNVGNSLLVSTTLTSSDFSAIGSTNLSNYILPTSASGFIGRISPLALTGSISGGNSVYGAALMPGLVSFTNSISGDNVSSGGVAISTAGNTSTSGYLKAGNYMGIESVNGLSGTDAANYSFAGIKGDYNVSQFALVTTLTNTITASVLGTAPLLNYGFNSPYSFTDIIVATDQKLLQCN